MNKEVNSWAKSHFFPDSFTPVAPKKNTIFPTAIISSKNQFNVPITASGQALIYWSPIMRLPFASTVNTTAFRATISTDDMTSQNYSMSQSGYLYTEGANNPYVLDKALTGRGGRLLSAYMDVEYSGSALNLSGMIVTGSDVLNISKTFGSVSNATTTQLAIPSQIPNMMYTRTYMGHEKVRIIYNIGDMELFGFTPYRANLHVPFFLVYASGFQNPGSLTINLREIYEVFQTYSTFRPDIPHTIIGEDPVNDYINLIKMVKIPQILTTVDEYNQIAAKILYTPTPKEKSPYSWVLHHFFPLDFPVAKLPDHKLFPTAIVDYTYDLMFAGGFTMIIDPLRLTFWDINEGSDNDFIARWIDNTNFISALFAGQSPDYNRARLISFYVEIEYIGETYNSLGTLTVNIASGPSTYKKSINGVATTGNDLSPFFSLNRDNVYSMHEDKKVYVIFNVCDKSQTRFLAASNKPVPDINREYFCIKTSQSNDQFLLKFRGQLEIIPSNLSSSKYMAEKELPGLSLEEQMEYIRGIFPTQRTNVLSEREYNTLVNKLK